MAENCKQCLDWQVYPEHVSCRNILQKGLKITIRSGQVLTIYMYIEFAEEMPKWMTD